MPLKNNRAPLLCCFKLCASCDSHQWIRTGVTVRKRPIWVKFDNFQSRATLKFDRWPCKTIGHLFYLLQSLCIISYPLVNSNLSYSLETLNLGQKRRLFEPWDLEIWRMTLQNNRAPLLCYFKLCAAFPTHWWIQIGVTIRKRPIWGQIWQFLEPCDLEIWRMTFKHNRAPLLSNIKLYGSFHHHMWIQTGVTVRKGLSWVVTSVTLTFDLWPWPFAGTLPWSLVITPENFMMIR